MAKYCRKCGHKKEECTCKKSNLNYPMIATIIITTLVVVGLVYFIISQFLVKQEGPAVSAPSNNQQEEGNTTSPKEDKTENKQEEKFNDWTQMISCTYLPQYNSNNYINYYLKNNKVVRIEHYNEYNWATNEQIKMQVEDLKEDGFKNIVVEGKSIKAIITSKDKLWKELCGDCTANDVYRMAENSFYENGMTCGTKDNK